MNPLHGVIGHPVALTGLKDPDDVGMVDSFGGLEFSCEPMDPGGTHPRKDFDSYLVPVTGVVGKVDSCHAALTQKVNDLVGPNGSNAGR